MEKTAQDIIIKPIITEHSMECLANGKYTFKVAKNANKVEIAKAVETLFKGVKVAKVNTISVRGKKRRMGRSYCFAFTRPSHTASFRRRISMRKFPSPHAGSRKRESILSVSCFTRSSIASTSRSEVNTSP